MSEVRLPLDPNAKAVDHPKCPECGLPMWLMRVVLGPTSENVFQCAMCDVGKSVNDETV